MREDFNELAGEVLTKAFKRIVSIDSRRWIEFLLDVHCTYTTRQILTALDDDKADVFFITLNKADKDYSPTTMYNDYSINEIMFHWQSQSTTSDTSPTGQRYVHHREAGFEGAPLR